MTVASPNFAFLAEHDPLLLRLAMLAERYVFDDPNSSLLKQRQLAELLARKAAANVGIGFSGDDQVSAIRALRDRNVITAEIADVFHVVRKAGNIAAHEATGTDREALAALQLTRKLAIWFHRAFARRRDFKPGPFAPPPNPEQETFGGLYVDARQRIVSEREIYVGTLNSAIVSPRDVFRHALNDHAAAVIDHPSGDPAPSPQNLSVTSKLVEIGSALGVEVLDHTVVAPGGFVSFKQRGLL